MYTFVPSSNILDTFINILSFTSLIYCPFFRFNFSVMNMPMHKENVPLGMNLDIPFRVKFFLFPDYVLHFPVKIRVLLELL